MNMSVSDVHTTLISYHHKNAKLMLLLLYVKFEIRLEYFASVQFSFFWGKPVLFLMQISPQKQEE